MGIKVVKSGDLWYCEDVTGQGIRGVVSSWYC